MRVCVVGLWHLGTVAAAGLAELGHIVCGFDLDKPRVHGLQRGEPPLYEPGLQPLLERHLSSGRLRFTADLDEAVNEIDVILLAFDTPVDEHDEVDLRPVWEAVEQLARTLTRDAVVVVMSQVPVGTCEEVARRLRVADGEVHLACVPENLRLGTALDRFLRPRFLVFGVQDEVAAEAVDALFAGIDTRRFRTSLRTAEMTKHAINAYLAAMISLGNSFANLCDEVGADALGVAAALRQDERVSPQAPLQPGLGFAGGTLARDVKVLTRLARQTGQDPALFDAVLHVNVRQQDVVLHKLGKVLGDINRRVIGVLGLTYKPGTSTLRRSVARPIIEALVGHGARVKAFDPRAERHELQDWPLTLCADPYEVCAGADALVLLTEWPEFLELDFARVKSTMRTPVVIDPKNALDQKRIELMGFEYRGVGRGR